MLIGGWYNSVTKGVVYDYYLGYGTTCPSDDKKMLPRDCTAVLPKGAVLLRCQNEVHQCYQGVAMRV